MAQLCGCHVSGGGSARKSHAARAFFGLRTSRATPASSFSCSPLRLLTPCRTVRSSGAWRGMGNAVSCGCGGLAPGALELIEAAKTGDVDVGLAALVSGTDVRCYDSAGWCVRMSEGGRGVVPSTTPDASRRRTALHHAVRNDHVLFAKMLLSQGASPDAENNVRSDTCSHCGATCPTTRLTAPAERVNAAHDGAVGRDAHPAEEFRAECVLHRPIPLCTGLASQPF